MTIHHLQAANHGATSHADADAVRMMVLERSQDAFDALTQGPRFGQARVVVSAGFPNRKVLTIGRTSLRN